MYYLIYTECLPILESLTLKFNFSGMFEFYGLKITYLFTFLRYFRYTYLFNFLRSYFINNHIYVFFLPIKFDVTSWDHSHATISEEKNSISFYREDLDRT